MGRVAVRVTAEEGGDSTVRGVLALVGGAAVDDKAGWWRL